jgi:hypothetical protein
MHIMHTLLLAAFLMAGSTILLCGNSVEAASQDPQRLTVDIVKIEGEQFHVKDENGAEGTIHVGSDTEQYGRFQPGDRIDAWVYPNGHAKTILIVRSASIIQEEQQNREGLHQMDRQQAQR